VSILFIRCTIRYLIVRGEEVLREPGHI
jgi:hypothetical protein